MNDLPKTMKIAKIVDEAKDVKTFIFRERISAKPGQYVMLWIPGIDEKPFSISYADREKFAVTVCAVGPFSKKLHEMQAGELVGIRGPYGNHFRLFNAKTKSHERSSGVPKHSFVTIALVGGGYGSAPLAFLANKARLYGYEVHFIIGAKAKESLLFEERMTKAGVTLHYCTDDGSYGFKGFTTQRLKALMEEINQDSKKEKIGKIFSCGPDIMEKKIIEIAEEYDVPCEISMERYMKCGIGICGNCCVDYLGIRVCREGPVFDSKIAKQIVDLGNYKRDDKGSKVMI